MSAAVPNPHHGAVGGQRFVTTQWSIVLHASDDDPAVAESALTRLCQGYWIPLYAYARRRGHGPDDAQDLTQEFFARVIEKRWLAGVKRDGGRFRSFLLTAFTRFMANEYDRQRAAKRGGGRPLLSLDQLQAEASYAADLQTDETPERVFERRWAWAILEQALACLGQELRTAGKGRHFDLLEAFLSREPEPGEYDAAGQKLQMSPGAIAAAVFRLRQRYREHLRNCVTDTVATAAEADEELRHLLQALRT